MLDPLGRKLNRREGIFNFMRHNFRHFTPDHVLLSLE